MVGDYRPSNICVHTNTWFNVSVKEACVITTLKKIAIENMAEKKKKMFTAIQIQK